MTENIAPLGVQAMCKGCPFETDEGKCSHPGVSPKTQFKREFKGICADSGVNDASGKVIKSAYRIKLPNGWTTIAVEDLAFIKLV